MLGLLLYPIAMKTLIVSAFLAVLTQNSQATPTCLVGLKGIRAKDFSTEALSTLKSKGYEITKRRHADFIVEMYSEGAGGADMGDYEWYGNTATLRHKRSGYSKKLFHQVKVAEADFYTSNPLKQSLLERAKYASSVTEYEGLMNQVKHLDDQVLVHKNENISNALARSEFRQTAIMGAAEYSDETIDESYGALIAAKLPSCETLLGQ